MVVPPLFAQLALDLAVVLEFMVVVAVVTPREL